MIPTLPLRSALRTALGASFSVTHAGPGGSVSVTVAAVDAGRDDETALPAVFIHSGFGNAEPAHIGGGAVENVSFVDLHIQTVDSENWDGALLLEDIHAKVETLIRAVEKTLGGSYFSLVSTYRDFPPQSAPMRTGYLYTRIVTVRGINVEGY